MFLIVAATLSAGCATTYQPKGWSGGYYDYKAGDNWVVGADVNSYTSRETAGQYAHKRASEICPKGYDVVQSTNTSATNVNDYSGNTQSYYKPGSELLIKCK